jgi:hypothetical protein
MLGKNVDVISHFFIFCLTIVAIFLTQAVFFVLLDCCTRFFGETPYAMTIILNISDILCTIYFVYYPNQALIAPFGSLLAKMLKIN